MILEKLISRRMRLNSMSRGVLYWAALTAAVLLIALAGYLSAWVEPQYVVIMLVVCLAALLLFRLPELALAVFFSGSNIYFYLLFRLSYTPNTLTTGLYWSSLITLAALGLFIIRKCRIRFSLIDFGVVALFLWIGISYLLFSYGTDWALNRLKFAPALAIAPFFAARLVNQKIVLSRFADFVLLLGKITGPVFAFELFTTFQDSIRFAPFYFGTNPQANNPIVIGTSFSIYFLILYWKIITGSQRLTLLNLGWLALFALIIVRAASRGPEIALIVAIVYMHLLGPLRPRQVAILVSIAVLCILIIAWTPDHVMSFYERTLEYTLKNSAVLRFMKWTQALNLFFSSPLLGVGFAQFSDSNAFTHNIVLEVAAELGLVGLLILTLIVGFTLITAHRSLKSSLSTAPDRELLRLLLGLFIFSFTAAQFSGFLTAQLYFFTSLGLLWGFLNMKKQPVLLDAPVGGQDSG